MPIGNVIEYRTKAALPRNNLAVLMEDQGRLDEAEKLQRHNLALWEGLAAGDPANPEYRSKVALTVDNLAPLLEKSGCEKEAEQCLRRVVELRRSLTEDFPNTPHHFCKLAEALAHRARMAGNRGEFAEARQLREQAITVRRAALALAPGNTNYRRWLADTCADLVETLITERKHEEATTAVAEIVSVAQDSAQRFASPRRSWRDAFRWRRATCSLRKLAAPRAEGYAERAIALLRQAVKKGHRDADAVRNDRGFDSLRAQAGFSRHARHLGTLAARSQTLSESDPKRTGHPASRWHEGAIFDRCLSGGSLFCEIDMFSTSTVLDLE